MSQVWDLGPFAAVRYNVYTWTYLSWSNEIQRNYLGLKITACMQQLGKILDERHKKTKKLNCHF